MEIKDDSDLYRQGYYDATAEIDEKNDRLQEKINYLKRSQRKLKKQESELREEISRLKKENERIYLEKRELEEINRLYQWHPIDTCPTDKEVMLGKFGDFGCEWVVSTKLSSQKISNDVPATHWRQMPGWVKEPK